MNQSLIGKLLSVVTEHTHTPISQKYREYFYALATLKIKLPFKQPNGVHVRRVSGGNEKSGVRCSSYKI